MKKQRAPGLIAIVLYKSFVASLLTVTSIAVLLALNSHHPFEAFSESLFLETKLNNIKSLLKKILFIKLNTLLLSGLATGMYATLTVVEAVGLWYEKGWQQSYFYCYSASVFRLKSRSKFKVSRYLS